ncbi:MAG: hypothetical protein IKI30_08460 [Oxalobacter sp.]|nr:hypothetical protein [Oxalobacter sp.]
MFQRKTLATVLFALLSGLAATATPYAADALFAEDAGPISIQENVDGKAQISRNARLLASTYHPRRPRALSLIRKCCNGKLYFMVTDKASGKNAFVEYSKKVYDFYLDKDGYGGYPPLMFVLSVPRDLKGNGDDGLGEWRGKVHHIPVYALFEVVNGRVMYDDDPFFSASYLNPSHYHDRIKDPAHVRLIKTLMSQMPELHEAVEKAGVRLP